jgi:hypothetical protein
MSLAMACGGTGKVWLALISLIVLIGIFSVHWCVLVKLTPHEEVQLIRWGDGMTELSGMFMLENVGISDLSVNVQPIFSPNNGFSYLFRGKLSSCLSDAEAFLMAWVQRYLGVWRWWKIWEGKVCGRG